MTQVRQREAQQILESMVIARYQMYPAYHDSGVEWLGEIPAHWDTIKLKYIFEILNGATPKSAESAFWDGDIVWITPDDLGRLDSRYIGDSRRRITREGYQNCGATVAPAGSIVISTRAPIGHIGIASVELCTNQGCRCLVSRIAGNNSFFYYLLFSAKAELQSLGQGSTFVELSSSKLASVDLLLPPLTEQRAIAAFLDRQTAKIDALIAKKRELIAALHEQRSAIISHAVTKGLNPDVPMKDSGIEWLGEIPAGWRLLKFKRVMRWIEQGWSPQAEGRPAADEEWGVLKVGCVNYGTFDPTENKALLSDTEPITRYEIHKGDLLVSRANTRELLGSAAVVGDVRSRLLLCDKLFRIHLRQDWVLPEFAALALISSNARYQIEREATGASASMQNVGQDTLFNLILPLPSIVEQGVIVSAIRKQLAYIDRVISTTEATIERLQEYRAALISAAVTGKIDVREGR